MTFKYERKVFEYLENLKRQIQAQPLLLGGISSSGGGSGGPPAGFIGYLPQTRVTYDISEASISSGSSSLVDNLNHIRNRLTTIENEASPGTITVKQNNIILASGIEELNLIGDVNITISGVQATINVGTIHTDNLTSYVNGISSSFATSHIFLSSSLDVYLNGLFNIPSGITTSGFTFDFVPPSGAVLIAKYKYFQNIGYGTVGWGGAWGS